ncbi:MAG TPA: indolepyruvate oxidoreductase subunit beta [Chitinivibrionales bacterium]
MEKSIQSDKTWNIFFCGTGGQGVLTAAELCAVAAMHAGFHVKKSEVHGMAQRGGSVESHVRFGKRIYSPLIEPKTADFLVCFHAGEGKRLSRYVKKGGINFQRFIDNPQYRPTDQRFFNTFFLGMLSAFLGIKPQNWQTAMSQILKRNLPENLRAFDEGNKAGLQFKKADPGCLK